VRRKARRREGDVTVRSEEKESIVGKRDLFVLSLILSLP
jgi:hypothetical protein